MKTWYIDFLIHIIAPSNVFPHQWRKQLIIVTFWSPLSLVFRSTTFFRSCLYLCIELQCSKDHLAAFFLHSHSHWLSTIHSVNVFDQLVTNCDLILYSDHWPISKLSIKRSPRSHLEVKQAKNNRENITTLDLDKMSKAPAVSCYKAVLVICDHVFSNENFQTSIDFQMSLKQPR